jgi:hypothetical protein
LEEIDQAAREAATALHTLGELARADYSIGPALRALDVLAADTGAEAIEEAASQLYGGPEATGALIRRAADTLRPLAN